MADNTERCWWDTVTGAVGCAAGTITIGVTGAATVATCAATVGAGCAVGGVALAYELDQTQASCRQMVSGQQTPSFGNQALGGGILGLGYDLAGLAGILTVGGAKLVQLIAKARAAGSLGDLADLARTSGKLKTFIAKLTDKDIELLKAEGKLAEEEIEAAGRAIPGNAQGGNVTAKYPRNAPNRGANWFDDVAKAATRNAESDTLVLGHFAREGSSYQKVAAHYRATYFKVDDWKTVTKGLSQDEIWRINETFLDQQIRQGKKILFSHDPLKARPNSFFEREVEYLRELGYQFRQKNQWTWEAVR